MPRPFLRLGIPMSLPFPIPSHLPLPGLLLPRPLRFLRILRHVLALVLLMLLADVCLLVSLLVKPFSEPEAWSLACWTASWFWGYMQYHWEDSLNASGCLKITGDEIPSGESAVIISNHLSYSDYYLIQALASRKGMLGNSRYFAKKELVWRIPIFGWSFWAIGMILVSRNWTNDAGLIEQAFARIRDHRHPCWVVLYPEGTRRSPGKIIQAYARLNGKAELRNVLFPRTKGLVATIEGLRNSHVQHIYDLTFLYCSPGSDRWRVPSLSDQLGCADLARAEYKFQIHVRRIPFADLPEAEVELKDWCEEAWRSKDALLDKMMDGEGVLKQKEMEE